MQLHWPDLSFEELEGEGVLPEQFFDAARQSCRQSAERRLLVAVLADGLRCFERLLSATTVRGQLEFGQVEEWVMEGETGAPLEFEYICGVLGLDVEGLRGRLRRLRVAGIGKRGGQRRVVIHKVTGEGRRRGAVGE